MEFFAIAKRLGNLLDADPNAWDPDPKLAARIPEPIGFDNAAKAEARAARLAEAGRTDAAAVAHAAEVHESIKAIPVSYEDYEVIRDAQQLSRWIAEIYRIGRVAVDTETTALDPQSADLVGIGIAVEPGKAAYLPLGH